VSDKNVFSKIGLKKLFIKQIVFKVNKKYLNKIDDSEVNIESFYMPGRKLPRQSPGLPINN
jgi:hypothetical protein